jgi:MYXO-CTERM domain-containing protein
VHTLVLSALISVVPLDIIDTLLLEGDIVAEGGDYALVPFEVPEGTVEIRFAHTDNSEADILDFGIIDPSGQRGWGGGLEEDSVIGVDESTRGYRLGPIAPGTWYVDIGKAKLGEKPVHYNITVEFHDAPTLTVRPRAPFEPRVLEKTARWYAGDFHVHSSESGDADATFDQIRDLCRERGIDFVNLSDHNIVTQHALVSAYQEGVDDVLFLRGSEVTTYAGHGNTVGNQSYINHHIGRDGHTIQDLLGQVEKDGAIFIVNHAKLALGDQCIGCAWDHPDTPWDKVAGIELQTGSYATIQIFEPLVIAMWDDLLDQGHRITGVSGSDDHRAPIEPPGGIESQIGTPTSMVFAEELSEAAIMAAIKAGRVVVKMRGPDDPMVELTTSTDRDEQGIIGDTVSGSTVSVEARVTGGDGLTLDLVRNGEIEETVTVAGDDFIKVFEREVRSEGDRYRVHLGDTADIVVTNHVWVEYAPATGGGDPDGGPDDGGGADGGDDEDEGGCGCQTDGGGAAWTGLLALAALAGLRRRRSRR